MSVWIAAQTVSISVASTINFLWGKMYVPGLEGCEGTSCFIKKVDMAYEILNSRNPFEIGYKSPGTLNDISVWMQTCDKLVSFFLVLKDEMVIT